MCEYVRTYEWTNNYYLAHLGSFLYLLRLSLRLCSWKHFLRLVQNHKPSSPLGHHLTEWVRVVLVAVVPRSVWMDGCKDAHWAPIISKQDRRKELEGEAERDQVRRRASLATGPSVPKERWISCLFFFYFCFVFWLLDLGRKRRPTEGFQLLLSERKRDSENETIFGPVLFFGLQRSFTHTYYLLLPRTHRNTCIYPELGSQAWICPFVSPLRWR